MKVHRAALPLATMLLVAIQSVAQTAKPSPPKVSVEQQTAGDAPAVPGPLAHLSPALQKKAVNAAMVKVMDWQLQHSQPVFNRLWTYAALYDGLLAASKATRHSEGHDAVFQAANTWNWTLEDTRFPHADDEALGRAYLDLYREHPEAIRKANTQEIMDRLVARPDDPKKNVWWWCDALFMAPPVLARLYIITHDEKYLDTMDREWNLTRARLYDPQQHLYFRDDRFVDTQAQHEANGKPIFWSRGNGWVIAGLVQILETLPPDNPHRTAYAAQFADMMKSIVALQPADGLWRAGLLDPDAYNMPEISGSAFFAYGMAYGLRTGMLTDADIFPALKRCWAAMVGHIYADGRLGNIQPVGASPDKFVPSSSYVYGVGGFLLAGSEIDELLARARAGSSR